MHKILSSDFLCCKILLFISRLFIFVFCQRCHATAPLTPRGRYPGARRDLRSPGGEAGAGAEIGAETGGGRETGDTGGTPQRAATQVRMLELMMILISLNTTDCHHCRLQL